ncbi:MAG: radical SAM protein [Lachnospiraceae bacterium]|jgi:spore photoproduct lyase|nr:radical SAM protein [Lachnospiraceae bacterium]MEE3460517.1 radical SAM protein [Lachnospiraceae bacterium]
MNSKECSSMIQDPSEININAKEGTEYSSYFHTADKAQKSGSYFLPAFSHVYVENEAVNYPLTKSILSSKVLKNSERIMIHSYKTIFNRRNQDINMQKRSRSLILAVKHDRQVYPGSRACQSFGNKYFYYTSDVLNCPFACCYCYLAGMYPGADIVIFVNIEDTFDEVRRILKEHPAYISISYETDLLSLEHITGFLKKWILFTAGEPDLTIEIRTKSADKQIIKSLSAGLNADQKNNVIFAFTLSPEKIAAEYEHMAPEPLKRIEALNTAYENGFTVRASFDPLIFCPDFKRVYGDFIDEAAENITFHNRPFDSLLDVSVGVFRISQGYLKEMRKKMPGNKAAWFPYELKENFYTYPGNIESQMKNFVIEELSKYISSEKIDSRVL